MAAVDHLLLACRAWMEENINPEDWKDLNPERSWDLVLAYVLGGFIPPSLDTIRAEEAEHERFLEENRRAYKEAEEAGTFLQEIPHPEATVNYQDRPVPEDRINIDLMTEKQKLLILSAFNDLTEMANRYIQAPPLHYSAYSHERVAWDTMRHYSPDFALLEFTDTDTGSVHFETLDDPRLENYIKVYHDVVANWLVNVHDGIMNISYTIMKPYYEKWEMEKLPNCKHCGRPIAQVAPAPNEPWLHYNTEIMACAEGGTFAEPAE